MRKAVFQERVTVTPAGVNPIPLRENGRSQLVLEAHPDNDGDVLYKFGSEPDGTSPWLLAGRGIVFAGGVSGEALYLKSSNASNQIVCVQEHA